VTITKKALKAGMLPQASALLQRDDGPGILPDFSGESPQIPGLPAGKVKIVQNDICIASHKSLKLEK